MAIDCGTRISNFLTRRFLDRKRSAFLLGGEESWVEIHPRYRVRPRSGECWDVRFMLDHFYHQLNSTDHIKPTPTLPFNPFTKQIYRADEVIRFLKHAREACIEIPVLTKTIIESNIYSYWTTVDKETVRRLCLIRYLQMMGFCYFMEKHNGTVIGRWVELARLTNRVKDCEKRLVKVRWSTCNQVRNSI